MKTLQKKILKEIEIIIGNGEKRIEKEIMPHTRIGKF
jgi:hypothetical protein